MSKLMMFSIIIATVAVPIRLSSSPTPQKALDRSVKIFLAFNFIYVLLLVMVVPRFL